MEDVAGKCGGLETWRSRVRARRCVVGNIFYSNAVSLNPGDTFSTPTGWIYVESQLLRLVALLADSQIKALIVWHAGRWLRYFMLSLSGFV